MGREACERTCEYDRIRMNITLVIGEVCNQHLEREG